MMITLFTTPKPFVGHFNFIQRNAIQSWTLLNPRPEIIILDKVEGGEEITKEFGLHYIPEVERNKYGTPLVSSIFKIVQKEAKNEIICYVNADIILTNSFIEGIEKVIKFMKGKDFLLVGRRWNVNLLNEWNFQDKNWEEKLWAYAKKNGYQESAGATDYFVFPKHIDWNIPPFAIGRSAWDGWFLWNACKKKIPLIDGTSLIKIFHQQHDYSHWQSSKTKEKFRKSEEFKINQKLRGSFRRQYNILDAPYLLTKKGLKKSPKLRKLEAEFLRFKMLLDYYLRGIFYPYSLPLIFSLKCLKSFSRSISNFLKK